ncbi:lacticin RM [Listeria booriae]|uniref:Lacticin RM n=1 Tax=Listeria booriae TaxID=1552123 RepID=A0A842AIM5_9LIST|nr:lacticin RM [Listeria booriae]MBC1402456.1 lacticin RM [Listeria booriae]MBC1616025.1 lacticin RM [Listeria booriae]
MLKVLSKKKVKMLAIAMSCSFAFTVASPSLNAYAEENLEDVMLSVETNQFEVDASQAISEIDSVGIEEVVSEDAPNTSNVQLLKAAAYKNKTYSYKRGGFAAWCRDNISYRYNGTTVAENSKWQEAGYLFPNIISKKGIKLVATGTGYRDYRGTKTYKIGTPSPWGDVAFSAFDKTDQYRVKSNGSGYLK